MDHTTALRAYDTQLRTEAETAAALAVTRLGPLHLALYEGGRGFVTYQDLGGADAAEVRRLVAGAVEHFRADPAVREAEWKTRGHDHAPGLHEALLEHGFVPDEPESVMIGDVRALAGQEPPLPEGVTLRRVTAEADVRAMCAMQARGFGHGDADRSAAELLRRLAAGEDLELWVAETDGRVVTAGRLEPVAGTEFAGIWGGVTLPEWRGRGIYRALTAARARSAIALGKRFVHSDSTEYSRPILERYGFLRVTTTTPYEWTRPGK
ncbi:GNAT family N-acetyltransferase [Streptomyces sp. NPDC047130]|uniref:GNAT family N-acetyltransferase n=1 Tax=Streptomyces sp. NPDC047130 TaxID=3155261 RepID=UPI0033C4C1D5